MRRTWTAIVAAGLAGAVVEMVFVLPIQAALGNTPVRLFQSIAMGAQGRAAFTGGAGSVALGVGVHLLVSLVAAAAYVLAAERQPVLLRRPILCGALFGAICYVVMTFVVIPLSKIGHQPLPPAHLMLASVLIHLFAFGAPIALTAKAVLQPASARR